MLVYVINVPALILRVETQQRPTISKTTSHPFPPYQDQTIVAVFLHQTGQTQ
jgi:hypothetical protein